MSNLKLGIIGAGNIADKHLKVLKKIKGIELDSIYSRTSKKSFNLAKKYKINNVCYDFDTFMLKKIGAILILVSAQNIFKISKKIIPYGMPVFIEKPAGLSPSQTQYLNKLSKKFKTVNMVGYNRRHYSIFAIGKKLIKNKGKLFNILIEGHERIWNLDKLKINKNIINNWIYANSTHTIDLLRFFGGEVSKIHVISSSFKKRTGDQFSCLIKFKNNAVGEYISNWYSPGGWSIKLFGNGVTVVFSPLEKGYWIDKKMKKHEINPKKYDKLYKPGFYEQMNFFVKIAKKNKFYSHENDLESAFKTMSLAKKLLINKN